MKLNTAAFVTTLCAAASANASVWQNKNDHGRDYVAISTSAAIPTQTVTRTVTEVPAAVTHTVTEAPAAVTHTVVPSVNSYELGVNEEPRDINTNTTNLMRRLVVDVTSEKVHKNGAGSVVASSVAGAFGVALTAALIM